jgi:2-amino-4-hydroxy-6-hydroxymethyldihydropteridine diphosphokinase
VRARAFVGIGSNVGNRRAYCDEATARLGCLPETEVLRISPYIETQPTEGVAGGAFLNGVAEVATGLSPIDLLRALQAIERALGRPDGHQPGTARTIDLDILLYGDDIVREGGLDIPHPRMAQRRFVLEPLAAVAPGVRHPVLQATAGDLLRDLEAGGPPHSASDAR